MRLNKRVKCQCAISEAIKKKTLEERGKNEFLKYKIKYIILF